MHKRFIAVTTLEGASPRAISVGTLRLNSTAARTIFNGRLAFRHTPTAGRRGVGLTVATVGLCMLTRAPANCAPDEGKEELPDGAAAPAGDSPASGGDDAVSKAAMALNPIVSKLGFGGMLGASAGYALKKIGKIAAFGTGCLFILFQGAAYAGYIDIHWNAVEAKVQEQLDLDGDGKVDMKDAVVVWKRYIKPMLTYHLPSAGGFSLGFFLGLKHG